VPMMVMEYNAPKPGFKLGLKSFVWTFCFVSDVEVEKVVEVVKLVEVQKIVEKIVEGAIVFEFEIFHLMRFLNSIFSFLLDEIAWCDYLLLNLSLRLFC